MASISYCSKLFLTKIYAKNFDAEKAVGGSVAKEDFIV